MGVSTLLRRLHRHGEPSPRYTIDYHRELSFSLPSLHPFEQKIEINLLSPSDSMSSSGQATSPTSNYQLIINALVDYAQITGIDLTKNPFSSALEQSSSPEAILHLLQEREKAFNEYRDGNRRLIHCLSPVVSVLQAFSGILGDAVSLVSHTCH